MLEYKVNSWARDRDEWGFKLEACFEYTDLDDAIAFALVLAKEHPDTTTEVVHAASGRTQFEVSA